MTDIRLHTIGNDNPGDPTAAGAIVCDSLIFDMDGTLWDAVDSYVRVWNITTAETGLDIPEVTRRQLIGMMGMHLEDIMAAIDPRLVGNTAYLEALNCNERDLMPRLGGRLYPDVKEVMARLSQRMPLFMVSNCGPEGLRNFLRYTCLQPYVADTLTHGENGLSKGDNIALMIQHHGLRHAVYVGDTQGDIEAAHAAGIACVHAAYGFGGDVHGAEASIAVFSQLPSVIKPEATRLTLHTLS